MDLPSSRSLWCHGFAVDAPEPGFLLSDQGALMPLSSFPNICPLCFSQQVITRDWARKVVGAIGCLVGAAGGFYSHLRGVPLVELATVPRTPFRSTVIGDVTGAVLGALAGATVGCEVGASVGKEIDKHMLNNYQCLDCGHAFNCQHSFAGCDIPQ